MLSPLGQLELISCKNHRGARPPSTREQHAFRLTASLTAVANTTQSLEQEHQHPYFQARLRVGKMAQFDPSKFMSKVRIVVSPVLDPWILIGR